MRACLLIMLLLAHFGVSQAALFDDTEARQQIMDLQKKVDTQNQSMQASLDAMKKTQQSLEQRIASIEAIVKGQGLMDMLAQVDRLNQDLSQVKGQLEVATHNLELTQQRQKDLYADVDGRVRKLEAGAVPVAPSAPAASNNAGAVAAADNEAKDFDAAQTLLKTAKFKEAFDAFDKFMQTYPKSSKLAEAQYNLGFSQFSLKNYKAAIATQEKLVNQFPDSDKAPDALFNLANSQIQLADLDGAKKTLRDLLAKYPNSEIAPTAKRRLAVLDSIKK